MIAFLFFFSILRWSDMGSDVKETVIRFQPNLNLTYKISKRDVTRRCYEYIQSIRVV